MKRGCLMVLGWLACGMGIVGIVLPLLPTTPFMLLAAALFARSSPRFHRWLLTHPWFGPSISDWQHHRGIRPQARRRAIISILLTFSLSLAVVPLWWVKGLLVVIMAILITVLMRLPLLAPVAMKK
ncbi:MAG: YbaN family protein [Aeromonas sp.]